MNPKNTVFDAKRLIGRKFSDPQVQHDMKEFSYSIVKGEAEKPMIEVEFHGEKKEIRGGGDFVHGFGEDERSRREAFFGERRVKKSS